MLQFPVPAHAICVQAALHIHKEHYQRPFADLQVLVIIIFVPGLPHTRIMKVGRTWYHNQHKARTKKEHFFEGGKNLVS